MAVTCQNERAIRFFEKFGDPERNYNAQRVEFDPLIQFLEENELWFHRIDKDEEVISFSGIPKFFAHEIPCRGKLRIEILIQVLVRNHRIKFF